MLGQLHMFRQVELDNGVLSFVLTTRDLMAGKARAMASCAYVGPSDASNSYFRG